MRILNKFKNTRGLISIFPECEELLSKTLRRLDRQIADDYGVVGVGARALGKAMDARVDYPYAECSFQKIRNRGCLMCLCLGSRVFCGRMEACSEYQPLNCVYTYG